MKYTKLFFKFIQGGLIVVVICVVTLLILGHFGYVETVKPFVVQSGSMEPSVPTASIVFSLPQSAYQQGDIITFHPNGNEKQTVTHRVEFKLYPDGINEAPLFMTAGDANKDLDKWEVRQEHIIGKTVLTVPFLGYLVDFAKKPEGFILLVIVPATIVIYEELKALFMEIIKGVGKLRKRYLQGETLKGGRTISSPPKMWVVLPLLGVIIFMVSFSAGYFSDLEKSLGNIFQAGTWGTPNDDDPDPSATPTPPVISGNPNCTSQGFTYGFKIDVTQMVDGKTYKLDASDGGELISGTPPDDSNTVTLSNFLFNDDEIPELTHFDWASTLSMDSVLVKAGATGKLYAYEPEAYSDSGLHASVNPANNKVFGISHIEFCYDYEE